MFDELEKEILPYLKALKTSLNLDYQSFQNIMHDFLCYPVCLWVSKPLGFAGLLVLAPLMFIVISILNGFTVHGLHNSRRL
jgi:hypothetical protein